MCHQLISVGRNRASESSSEVSPVLVGDYGGVLVLANRLRFNGATHWLASAAWAAAWRRGLAGCGTVVADLLGLLGVRGNLGDDSKVAMAVAVGFTIVVLLADLL